jgi:hypothetical protein
MTPYFPEDPSAVIDADLPSSSRMTSTPNPFAGSTEIALDHPTGEGSTVDIFDTSGRRLRRLTIEAGTRGRAAVIWDGRDEAGAQVGSGVYYAIVAGARARTLIRIR